METAFFLIQIKVVSFHHPPAVIYRGKDNTGKDKYDGLEVAILSTIASTLNFRYKISKTKDGEKWGSQLSNKQWSGMNK